MNARAIGKRTFCGRFCSSRRRKLSMLRSVDSLTNFVMLNTGRRSQEVVEHFAGHRILVAGPVAGYDKYIRVSLGTAVEMREFWRVWDLMPGGHMHT